MLDFQYLQPLTHNSAYKSLFDGISTCYAGVVQRIIRFLKKHFGRKEWAALIGSLVLMILVTWLLTRATEFKDLGYLGGFLAMLLSSATVILPAPGLAVVAALGTTVSNPLLLGITAGLGAGLGEITGYLAGYGGRKIIEEQKHYKAVERFVERFGFWAILVLAAIPNPLFDVAGIMAGGTKYPFGLFLSATLIGKIIRCIMIAYLGASTLSWLVS